MRYGVLWHINIRSALLKCIGVPLKMAPQYIEGHNVHITGIYKSAFIPSSVTLHSHLGVLTRGAEAPWFCQWFRIAAKCGTHLRCHFLIGTLVAARFYRVAESRKQNCKTHVTQKKLQNFFWVTHSPRFCLCDFVTWQYRTAFGVTLRYNGIANAPMLCLDSKLQAESWCFCPWFKSSRCEWSLRYLVSLASVWKNIKLWMIYYMQLITQRSYGWGCLPICDDVAEV